ncbi:AAA family ATPase [Candidatus Saccharibacteria bacterium]|nr:AAA family ATPase [Candidatus Saccharibacteria bacterium]
MAINLREQMVLINGEPKTKELAYCLWNNSRHVYNVRWKNADRYYCYSKRHVEILSNPNQASNEELKSIQDLTNLEAKETYIFKSSTGNFYNTIFLKSGGIIELPANDFQNYKKYNFLKTAANYISNDKNMLSQAYAKLSFTDTICSALNFYFGDKNHLKTSSSLPLIFPFDSNESQLNAVENAILNNISFIEGPPGTGKTQTILNILANLIIRKQTIQVVSNNNSAIENIEEKLHDLNLDFFIAKLGSSSNKDEFIKNQKNLPEFRETKFDFEQTAAELKSLYSQIQEIYQAEKELAKLRASLSEAKTEYQHYLQYLSESNIKTQPIPLKGNSSKIFNKILAQNKIHFWQKFLLVYLYRVGNFAFFSLPKNVIEESFKKSIFEKSMRDLRIKIAIKEEFLSSLTEIKRRFKDLSMRYFKESLKERYSSLRRRTWTREEIFKRPKEFLLDYPIILSTTYSSRNSFSLQNKFDYVIMDEASQIDVPTGALALSSASNAVIVGDEKQLPNVPPPENILRQISHLRNKLDLPNEYDLSQSFLSSAKSIIDAPKTLLQEHYRCHPKIINFCNEYFYNNQLVIMTKDANEEDTIQIIHTVKGNHAADHTNYRQIDIIKKLLQNTSLNKVGIITPYRNQADEIAKQIPGVNADTIHKFQGRECDEIIISTVDNSITNFVDDPHILNVAISRAKKKLTLIITGNEIKNSNLRHFIDYVEYHNFKNSEAPLYSIFDFLYKQFEQERQIFFKNRRRISKYESENLMHELILDELKNFSNLGAIFQQPLYSLIRDKNRLSDTERYFVENPNSKIDFLIYDQISKKPILAIEVDGYAFHKQGTVQKSRDNLKDSILERYHLPLIRFSTKGSRERERLHKKLLELS